MDIYVTHCSAKKRKGKRPVRPDALYVSRRIQSFMRRCKEHGVKWAILSDLYGIWFPHIKHVWHDKPPSSVTVDEFDRLVIDFNRQLNRYKRIYFYYHPARFHNIYRRLLKTTRLRNRVTLIHRVSDII